MHVTLSIIIIIIHYNALSFLQVHVMITKSTATCYLESGLADYEEDDEEDLSDTDPEDEWESQAV